VQGQLRCYQCQGLDVTDPPHIMPYGCKEGETGQIVSISAAEAVSNKCVDIVIGEFCHFPLEISLENF